MLGKTEEINFSVNFLLLLSRPAALIAFPFPDTRPFAVARSGYREFMESGMAEDDKEMLGIMEGSPLCGEGEGFKQFIGGLHQKLIAERHCPEDVSFRRRTDALEPERILEVMSEELDEKVGNFRERRRNSPLRSVAAQFLQRYGGQTQREVARHLGMVLRGIPWKS